MRFRQAAFTIVELILVLVLLGVIAAISIPRFFDSQTFTSFFTKSEFESALTWTRNRAVTSQCAHEFRITSTGWFVLRDDDRNATTDNDCSSQQTATGCSAGEHFSFIYRDANDAVTDGGNTPLSGTDIASANLRRLIFTADGQLFQLATAPADSATGCTALTDSDRLGSNQTLLLDDGLSLSVDGTTAYVAVQP